MIILKQVAALGLLMAFVQATIPPEPTTTTFNTPDAISNGFDLLATTTEETTTDPTTTTEPTTTDTTTEPTTTEITTTPTTTETTTDPTTPGTSTITTLTTTVCHSTRHSHSRSSHHHHHRTRTHTRCHSDCECDLDCDGDSDRDCNGGHSRLHCRTQSYTTCIEETTCCIYIYPCPTNTTSTITSTSVISVGPASGVARTSRVAPTYDGVAPTHEEVAPTHAIAPINECVPCTLYVSEVIRPTLVCTTMIFCDAADQSEDCRLQNELNIERIANEALRKGGQVFINGQLVVFANSGSNRSSSEATIVVSRTSLITATGQVSNDAAPEGYGNQGLVGALALLAGIAMFA